MAERTVEMGFEFGSTDTYLSVTRIEEQARRHPDGRLGALFPAGPGRTNGQTSRRLDSEGPERP